MAGTLLNEPVLRAIDANGLAMAGAKLQFYLTGTTTPANTYTASNLVTPNANPVIADSGGLFAPIYLDPAVAYRCQLKTSGGSIVEDIDPLNNVAGVTTFNTRAGVVTLSSADVTGALTYTPVNKAGDTATALNVTPAGTPAQNAGGYLIAPIVTKDADYTFAMGDIAKLFRHTDGTGRAWTIPPNASVAFPIGTVIVGRNFGTGVVTITRGAAVSQRIAGSATDKDVAVAQYGAFSLVKEDTNIWYVTGTGLS